MTNIKFYGNNNYIFDKYKIYNPSVITRFVPLNNEVKQDKATKIADFCLGIFQWLFNARLSVAIENKQDGTYRYTKKTLSGGEIALRVFVSIPIFAGAVLCSPVTIPIVIIGLICNGASKIQQNHRERCRSGISEENYNDSSDFKSYLDSSFSNLAKCYVRSDQSDNLIDHILENFDPSKKTHTDMLKQLLPLAQQDKLFYLKAAANKGALKAFEIILDEDKDISTESLLDEFKGQPKKQDYTNLLLKKKATTGTAKILLEAIQLEDTNFIRYLIENKAHTKENTPEIAFDIITLAAQKECVGNRQFHILCSAINIRDHKDKIDDTFLRKINTIEKIDTLLLVVNKPSWPYCATITFSQEISENILSNEKYKNAFESKVAEFSYDPQTHLHIAQFFNRCETAFFIAIEKGDEKNVEKHMFNRFFTNSDKDPVMVAFQHNVSDTILKILLDRKLQQKENEAHQKQIEQYISYAIEHNRVEPFLRIVQSQPPLFKKRTMEQLIRQASDNVARYPFIKALLPADSTLTNGKTDRHWVEVLIKSDDHLSFEESTKIHLLNIATYSEKVVGESVSRLMTDYNMLPEIKAPPLLLMKIDSLLGNPLFQQEAYKANSQLGEKVLLSLYAVDPEENSNISAFVDKKIEQDETNITNKVKNRDEHWIEVCCCSKNKGAQLLRSELINEIQRYDPENQASRESLSTLYSNIRSSLTLKHIVDAEVLYETYKAGPLHLRFLIQDSLGQSEIFYYPHEMLFQKKDRLIEFYNLLVGEDEKTIDFLFEISFAITNFWRPPAYSNLWPTKDCDKFRVDLRRRLLPLSCNQHWVLILSEAARNATITPEEYAEMLAKSPLFIPDESEDNTLTIDKDLLIPITLIHEKDRKEQIVAVIRQMLEAKDNISEQGRQRWADFVKNQESFLQK